MVSNNLKPEVHGIFYRVRQSINPIFIYTILGILFGIFILHPLSMIIIGCSGEFISAGAIFQLFGTTDAERHGLGGITSARLLIANRPRVELKLSGSV